MSPIVREARQRYSPADRARALSSDPHTPRATRARMKRISETESEEVLTAFNEGKITERQAYEIASLRGEALQTEALYRVRGKPVSETRRIVDEIKSASRDVFEEASSGNFSGHSAPAISLSKDEVLNIFLVARTSKKLCRSDRKAGVFRWLLEYLAEHFFRQADPSLREQYKGVRQYGINAIRFLPDWALLTFVVECMATDYGQKYEGDVVRRWLDGFSDWMLAAARNDWEEGANRRLSGRPGLKSNRQEEIRSIFERLGANKQEALDYFKKLGANLRKSEERRNKR